jgi:hypothetical protein
MTTIEKDEELEKLINYKLNHWVDDFQEIEQDNQDNIKKVCRMVAAFSAKRSREKAIEECKSALSPCFSVDVMMCFDKLKSL